MSCTGRRIVLGVLVLALTGATAAWAQQTLPVQPPQPTQPPALIVARRVEASADVLANASAAEWARIEATGVPLSAAFSVVPGRAFETRTTSLRVKALHNGREVFIWLNWKDGRADASVVDTRFADGAAIQFPLSKGQMPEYFMGLPDAHVNIVYWRPDFERPRNVVAAGFGTSTITGEQNLGSRGVWALGEWTVILWRALATESAYQTQLKQGETTSIAFAVWDGANGERDGHKSVSFWQNFRLE